MAPLCSGLARRPLKAVARVQIPSGLRAQTQVKRPGASSVPSQKATTMTQTIQHSSDQHSSDQHSARTALVLGGGGSAGNAWLIGVVAGLVDAGIDVTQADLVVGTSAGA